MSQPSQAFVGFSWKHLLIAGSHTWIIQSAIFPWCSWIQEWFVCGCICVFHSITHANKHACTHAREREKRKKPHTHACMHTRMHAQHTQTVTLSRRYWGALAAPSRQLDRNSCQLGYFSWIPADYSFEQDKRYNRHETVGYITQHTSVHYIVT